VNEKGWVDETNMLSNIIQSAEYQQQEDLLKANSKMAIL